MQLVVALQNSSVSSGAHTRADERRPGRRRDEKSGGRSFGEANPRDQTGRATAAPRARRREFHLRRSVRRLRGLLHGAVKASRACISPHEKPSGDTFGDGHTFRLNRSHDNDVIVT